MISGILAAAALFVFMLGVALGFALGRWALLGPVAVTAWLTVTVNTLLIHEAFAQALVFGASCAVGVIAGIAVRRRIANGFPSLLVAATRERSLRGQERRPGD